MYIFLWTWIGWQQVVFTEGCKTRESEISLELLRECARTHAADSGLGLLERMQNGHVLIVHEMINQ